ncbi:hypothetical protein DOTSEDRAFT_89563 [Dothistroma septosporum NZE10]|uniref:Uncharacterized protein n=1 Tax=Dothistroma septosporum (strain NZE10 / CBS 128990) TaxID=675120 RepID=N1PHH5_DOTSN|nr:hypothetical protein DOTSEDRAFT_89563 [Dothistroma septosporum NZE10]
MPSIMSLLDRTTVRPRGGRTWVVAQHLPDQPPTCHFRHGGFRATDAQNQSFGHDDVQSQAESLVSHT